MLFLQTFAADDALGFVGWTASDTTALVGRDVPEYTNFMRTGAKPSFGGGQIRFVGNRGLSAKMWNGPAGWRQTWPGRPHLAVFAYDWLARQYAFDSARLVNQEPRITLLDPSDGAVMESDKTFSPFLDLLAGPSGEGIRSTRLHAAWIAAGGKSPNPLQCVGFKHPLAFGGKQTVDNLELTDMDVYVSMMGQLYPKIAEARARSR